MWPLFFEVPFKNLTENKYSCPLQFVGSLQRSWQITLAGAGEVVRLPQIITYAIRRSARAEPFLFIELWTSPKVTPIHQCRLFIE